MLCQDDEHSWPLGLISTLPSRNTRLILGLEPSGYLRLALSNEAWSLEPDEVTPLVLSVDDAAGPEVGFTPYDRHTVGAVISGTALPVLMTHGKRIVLAAPRESWTFDLDGFAETYAWTRFMLATTMHDGDPTPLLTFRAMLRAPGGLHAFLESAGLPCATAGDGGDAELSWRGDGIAGAILHANGAPDQGEAAALAQKEAWSARLDDPVFGAPSQPRFFSTVAFCTLDGTGRIEGLTLELRIVVLTDWDGRTMCFTLTGRDRTAAEMDAAKDRLLDALEARFWNDRGAAAADS